MEDTQTRNERLRTLPSVDQVLGHPTLAPALAEAPRDQVTAAVREAVDAARTRILAGEEAPADADAVAREARGRLARLLKPSLRRVVNATGVIIHTAAAWPPPRRAPPRRPPGATRPSSTTPTPWRAAAATAIARSCCARSPGPRPPSPSTTTPPPSCSC